MTLGEFFANLISFLTTNSANHAVMFFETGVSCHRHPFFNFSHNIHEGMKHHPYQQNLGGIE